MSWDFKNTEGLLKLCSKHDLPISEVMIRREMQLGQVGREYILRHVDESLRVMDVAVDKAVSDPVPSMGGLLGGEAKKVYELDESRAVCGPAIHKAIVTALAVSETNASMGKIIAAPTAGSAGVLPAVLLSFFQEHNVSVETIRSGFLNASAIGYILTRNGSVSGAEAGCHGRRRSDLCLASCLGTRDRAVSGQYISDCARV